MLGRVAVVVLGEALYFTLSSFHKLREITLKTSSAATAAQLLKYEWF